MLNPLWPMDALYIILIPPPPCSFLALNLCELPTPQHDVQTCEQPSSKKVSKLPTLASCMYVPLH